MENTSKSFYGSIIDNVTEQVNETCEKLLMFSGYIPGSSMSVYLSYLKLLKELSEELAYHLLESEKESK